MKILFVSTEFEEQARGITSIIKAMIQAAKAEGHEVGILVGYPYSDQRKHSLLDQKVEHLYLQHYLATGKKNLYPNLRNRRVQFKVIATREYSKTKEMRVKHDLLVNSASLANSLDYIIKIPYVYKLISHGLDSVSRRSIKKAVRKHKVDLVITGAPLNLSRQDVSPAKLAQFVHDTMPIDLLETPADNQTPQKFVRQFYTAITESDLVLTNSADTANKVHEINPNVNTRIVYGAASSKATDFHDTSYLARKGLEKDKYLLFISVLELRKNLNTLFDAYLKAYPKIKMPLVVVGGKGFGYKQIMMHYKDLPESIRKNIILTGFIDESDKYTLLNNARAFIFPSIYEGLGLPIIEAFASNLPVLTTRKGALPEAGGEAALYVENPYDVNEVSDGMIKITQDEELRTMLRKHMPEQLEKFTVEKFATRFKDALDSLSRSSRESKK